MVKLSKAEQFMVNFNLFWMLNCYIKIFPISAEVQPLGSMLAGIHLLVRLDKNYLRFGSIYFLLVSFQILINLSKPEITLSDIIETIIIHIVGITTFVYVVKYKNYFTATPLIITLVINGIVGSAQAFYPQLFSFFGLGTFIQTLIPRCLPYSLSFIGRGVCLLSPEPSMGATLIIACTLLSLFLYHSRRTSKNYTVVLIMLSLYLTIINGSMVAYGFILTWIFLVFVVLNRKSIYSLLAVFLILFSILSLLILSNPNTENLTSSQTRLNNLITAYATTLANSASLKDSFLDSIDFINNATGNRTTSTIIGFARIFSFGSGLGSYNTEFYEFGKYIGLKLDTYEYFNTAYSGFYSTNIKPSNFIAFICFDLGIFTLILIYTVLHPFTTSLKKYGFLLKSCYLACAILFLSGASTAATPHLLICTAVAFKDRKSTKNNGPLNSNLRSPET